MKSSWTYITANKPNGTIYVGMTAHLKERMHSHKTKKYKNSFSARYNCDRLVYFETFTDINDAYAREKQLKAGSRAKKIKLIESINPQWQDLTDTL